MAESAEARKARNERRKARMASDPEYAARERAKDAEAKRRYEAKKRFTRETSGPVGSGKPGRIVALCGWAGW